MSRCSLKKPAFLNRPPPAPTTEIFSNRRTPLRRIASTILCAALVSLVVTFHGVLPPSASITASCPARSLRIVVVLYQIFDLIKEPRASDEEDSVHAVNEPHMCLVGILSTLLSQCCKELLVLRELELHFPDANRTVTLQTVGYEVAGECDQTTNRCHCKWVGEVHGYKPYIINLRHEACFSDDQPIILPRIESALGRKAMRQGLKPQLFFYLLRHD